MILHSPALAYNLLACHVVRHDCAQPVRWRHVHALCRDGNSPRHRNIWSDL